MREWQPLAEANDLAAMRNLGHLHRWGRGVKQDAAEAARWYRRAADLGFDRAQANLAALYLNGEGVKQDHAEAAYWFQRAALQGHTVAQYNLALLHELGLGVPKDPARALGWYNLAARAGHPLALQRLSALVQEQPVAAPPAPPPTDRTAPPPAAPSEDTAPSRPQTALAEPPATSPPAPRTAAAEEPREPAPSWQQWDPIKSFVESLFGVDKPAPANQAPADSAAAPVATATATAAPVASAEAAPAADAAVRTSPQTFAVADPHAALAQWLPLAYAGDPQAQFSVGDLYRRGLGVPVDRVRAHMWWRLAARRGHAEAAARLAALAAEMTPAQVSEAEALATEFRARP